MLPKVHVLKGLKDCATGPWRTHGAVEKKRGSKPGRVASLGAGISDVSGIAGIAEPGRGCRLGGV